jgi:hypothetical protein
MIQYQWNNVATMGLPGVVALPPIPGNTVVVGNRSNLPQGAGTFASPYSTLAAAIANTGKIRANSGDAIVILPGHSENVASATALTGLPAGVTIIGLGLGGAMPTFRWTDTAAQWAINVANVSIMGLRLRLEGANGIVKGINVTGADCTFANCDFEFASGASNLATIGLEVGSGGDRFRLSDSRVRGTGGTVTDPIKIAAAIAGFEIENVWGAVSANTANGIIDVTAAATNGMVNRFRGLNTTAASVAAFNVANVASSGFVTESHAAVLNSAGTASAQGFVFGAASTWRISQAFAVDAANANSILAPAAGT